MSEKQADYANQLAARAAKAGLRFDVDAGADKLGAKIRRGRNQRIPYVVVVGEQEAADATVSPRSSTDGDLGTMSADDFFKRVSSEARAPGLRKEAIPNGTKLISVFACTRRHQPKTKSTMKYPESTNNTWQ